jgi:hypothetical protein
MRLRSSVAPLHPHDLIGAGTPPLSNSQTNVLGRTTTLAFSAIAYVPLFVPSTGAMNEVNPYNLTHDEEGFVRAMMAFVESDGTFERARDIATSFAPMTKEEQSCND